MKKIKLQSELISQSLQPFLHLGSSTLHFMAIDGKLTRDLCFGKAFFTSLTHEARPLPSWMLNRNSVIEKRCLLMIGSNNAVKKPTNEKQTTPIETFDALMLA